MRIACVQRRMAASRMHEQDRKALGRAYTNAYVAAQQAGSPDPEAAANAAFDAAALRLLAQRRRVARMIAATQRRITTEAEKFRDLKGEPNIGEFGQQWLQEVHFRIQARFRMDVQDIDAFVDVFRRRALSGTRQNTNVLTGESVLMDHILDEIHGVNTGNVEAQAMAQAWLALVRRKVGELNEAGADISMRSDWFMPQKHNAFRISEASPAEWVNFITPLLDDSRMVDPETGLAFTPQSLNDFLHQMYIDITRTGIGGVEGTAMWRRQMHTRHLIFKGPQQWRSYANRFGGGHNLVETMFSYLHEVNYQLGAMDMLGPNPSGMVTWLVNEINRHSQLQARGEPNLIPKTNWDFGAVGDLVTGGKFSRPWRNSQQINQYVKTKQTRIQQQWDTMQGAHNSTINEGWALFDGTVRNLAYASALAFTPLIQGSDLVNQLVTRAYNGHDRVILAALRDAFYAAALGGDKRNLARLAVEMDVAHTVIMQSARDMATTRGTMWSQQVADRALTFSGLKPLTMGFRAMYQMDSLHALTDNAGRAWADLPTRYREFLERYRIDEELWDVLRTAQPQNVRGLQLITPEAIARTAGVRANGEPIDGRELALRFMGAVLAEGEAATVSGTPRSNLFRLNDPGTIMGTIGNSFAALKTYSIGHWQVHARRAAAEFQRYNGGIGGTGAALSYYILQLTLPGLALSAMTLLIRAALSGQQPPDVDDPEFWIEAGMRSVSLGMAQDAIAFAANEDIPVSQRLASLTGLTISRYAQGLEFGVRGGMYLAALLDGDEETIEREQSGFVRSGTRLARDMLPRHWGTDAAVTRWAWDNLELALDPKARERLERADARPVNGMWWGRELREPGFGRETEPFDLGLAFDGEPGENSDRD